LGVFWIAKHFVSLVTSSYLTSDKRSIFSLKKNNFQLGFNRMMRLKFIFHSIISPPQATNFDDEITLLHLFATEEICSLAAY
jgi:hypothetical protein